MSKNIILYLTVNDPICRTLLLITEHTLIITPFLELGYLGYIPFKVTEPMTPMYSFIVYNWFTIKLSPMLFLERDNEVKEEFVWRAFEINLAPLSPILFS